MGTLTDRQHLVDEIFKQYDDSLHGSLDLYQLQAIHADMRLGGISIPQVKAAVEYTCIGDQCEKEELIDVLQEMDRRYFLIQNLKWEFSMLDYSHNDTISEQSARWLVQSVHGDFFSKRMWEKFLMMRAAPRSGVSFAEIEVMLCNIPSVTDIIDEEEDEKRRQKERERKQQELEKKMLEEREKIKKQRDEERKKRDEENKKRKLEEDKRRKEEDDERRARQKEKDEEEQRRKKLEEDEERGRREAEERERKRKEEQEKEEKARQEELQELQRLKEMEEKAAREEAERQEREANEALNDEEILKQAIIDEKDSQKKMEEARKKAQAASDARTKKEHEDEEKRQKLRNKEARNKRIRYQLKVSYKKREREKLPGAVKDFKDAKLPDDDMDLEKAEKLLKEWTARDGLKNAMDKRQLKELESAINYVKRNGFEPQLAKEMIEANKVLLQLRRLERIRAEILELKQSTVAEIRSYQKPPAIVHTVMIATFLLHGHKEKETKVWKTVQGLVGKTGKEGLKRRCLECEPHKLNAQAAARAKELLSEFGLDDVRDVSAGAATFYLWSSTMIEEFEAKQAAEEEVAVEKKEAAAATGSLKKKVSAAAAGGAAGN